MLDFRIQRQSFNRLASSSTTLICFRIVMARLPFDDETIEVILVSSGRAALVY